MPGIHLRQSRFICSVYEPFTKTKEKLQQFKETGYSLHIYQKELDKACFEFDMAYGGFKDLPRTTASDKVLRDKALNIAKNKKKYDGYQREFASWVHKFA